MATPKLILYFNSASGAANSVRFFLKYHNISFIEERFVDLMAGDQYSDEYLKINPYHSVPVLKDETNDVTLTESAAIILYLADLLKLHGDYGYPTDLKQRGAVLNFMARHPYAIRTPFLTTFASFYKALFDDNADLLNKEEIREGLEESKAKHFPILENILVNNKGYLTGQPTIADIYYVVDLSRYLTAGDGMHIYDFDDFPAVKSWIKLVKEATFDDSLASGTFVMLSMVRSKFNLSLSDSSKVPSEPNE